MTKSTNTNTNTAKFTKILRKAITLATIAAITSTALASQASAGTPERFPMGSIHTLDRNTATTALITGRAADPDRPTLPVLVEITVSGNLVATTAAKNGADGHDYAVSFPVDGQTRQICATAIGRGPSKLRRQLGCNYLMAKPAPAPAPAPTPTPAPAPAPAPAQSGAEKKRSEQEVCFVVGVRANHDSWSSDYLHSSDKGFGWMNSSHSYTLYLKGTKKLTYPNLGNYQWVFEPTRFAVKGESVSNSKANPSGQALGSRTEFGLTSNKTSYSWSVSLPFGVSGSWANNNTTRLFTLTNFENTKSSAYSGIVGAGNSFNGPAGLASGLKHVQVRTAAIPGADTAPFWTAPSSWKLQTVYRGALNGSAVIPGLTGYGCDGVNWK